jgi:hypothetical protein
MRGQRVLLSVALLVLAGCSRSPPPSRFPNAAAALERMRATYRCSRGVSGEAKVDYFGERGRVRASTLYLAMLPDNLRFDVFSPFGVMLSTLTSDGENFSLLDTQNRVFWYGPANACNMARFTQVPVPPYVLLQLLRGEAPVLVHRPEQASLGWDGDYVVRLAGDNDTQQQIRLEPKPSDWALPWQQQRVRVLGVSMQQQGFELYRAALTGHARAHTAKPYVDPDGLDPTIPPSGPHCDAEVPRRLRLEVPNSDQDIIFVQRDIRHNPPLTVQAFTQPVPSGVSRRFATCTSP